jgi:hypothetical protein
MKKNVFSVLILFFLLGVGFVLALQNQKQQDIRSRASASSTISLTPSSSLSAPIRKKVGDSVTFDIMLNPGENAISTVKLHISFDSSFFEAPQNALAINTSIFPATVEGPIVNNDAGSVIATLSVGFDPKRAITAPVKIGTITLTALKENGGLDISTGKIAFEQDTQAYSVSPNDYAYENVIATAIPAYVVVRSRPTPTPTGGTKASSKNVQPKPTLTPPLPKVTPILSQGVVPTAMSTIAPTGATTVIVPTEITPPFGAATLTFKIFLHGIGIKDRLDNKFPKQKTRYVVASLLDSTNAVAVTHDVLLQYDERDGSFNGKLIIPALNRDSYLVKIKADGYLETQTVSRQDMVGGGDYVLPPISLTPGDLDRDRRVTIFDYNLLIACVDGNRTVCTSQVQKRADLDDNGQVDVYDAFIFVK